MLVFTKHLISKNSKKNACKVFSCSSNKATTLVEENSTSNALGMLIQI